jgi:chloramphenicol 3-O phosphotransferase
MYQAIAQHSHLGFNVVVDVGHHDAYSVPLGILPTCARLLIGLPVLFVGVHCPVEVIMRRRRATWQATGEEDGVIPIPVQLWQQAVHTPGIYDMEVDTSQLSPEACAALIQKRLHDGPTPTAFTYLASLANG